MEKLAPNDRVVAVNIDLSWPVHPGSNYQPQLISFPDGPLRRDRIYHVHRAVDRADGHQAVFITGTRVFLGDDEIPWDGSRFRKVDCIKGHVPLKKKLPQCLVSDSEHKKLAKPLGMDAVQQSQSRQGREGGGEHRTSNIQH